jgi:hypothetical protein
VTIALVTIASLIVPLVMFVVARKADRELPPADILPMKFGPSDEPLQEEPRAFALFLFPWLAVALLLAACGILYLARAPAEVVVATQAALALAMLVAQLVYYGILRSYLNRRN